MDSCIPNHQPCHMARFIIATFERLKVDWSVIVADSLRTNITSLVNGKKAWCGLAQWLTLLVPPTRAIKPKKRAQPEITPNKSSKWQQLLSKHTPRWTTWDSSQQEEVQTTWREEQMEPILEKTAKPIKINLVRRVIQETAEEEVEDELAEALQHRPRKCGTK